MPILWRYLLSHFLKTTCICTLAFLVILLTMRLDEIAHFIALGAPLKMVLLFTMYQIPYILPLAIPLSCLIASFLLMQRLSSSQELTALRAGGFSIKNILAPLLLTAAFLGLANFWLISELATHSHLKINLFKSQLRAINPLLLLNNKHLMQVKGFYFDSLGESYIGESASDIILAIPASHHQTQMNLFLAKNLMVNPSIFVAEQATWITEQNKVFSSPYNYPSFDSLLIENFGEMVTKNQDFTAILQKKVWTINNDYLQLPVLLFRAKEQRKFIRDAKKSKFANQEVKLLQMHFNRSISEIIKRFSIAIAVFSLTLLGIAFGLVISRQQNSRSLFFAIFLTAIYLVTYFVAKGLESNQWLAASFYLVPHLLLIGISCRLIRQINQGIETSC